MTGEKSCSSLVSPESSIGGHSDQQYAWHGSAAGPSELYDAHSIASRAAYDSAAPSHQQHDAHDQPQARPQLPDLDSSQPGPIEIDTSLLYTPQSGASSADVSQSGTVPTIPCLLQAAAAGDLSSMSQCMSAAHSEGCRAMCMPETCYCHTPMPGKVALATFLLLSHTSLIMSAIKARGHLPGVREECQSAWHHSEQYQADGEAESGYHGNDPVVGEEGVPSISRSSLSDSGFVSGPARSGSRQQRATSAPRDRPNFRATVPRWVNPLQDAHVLVLLV